MKYALEMFLMQLMHLKNLRGLFSRKPLTRTKFEFTNNKKKLIKMMKSKPINFLKIK